MPTRLSTPRTRSILTIALTLTAAFAAFAIATTLAIRPTPANAATAPSMGDAAIRNVAAPGRTVVVELRPDGVNTTTNVAGEVITIDEESLVLRRREFVEGKETSRTELVGINRAAIRLIRAIESTR